MQGNQKLLSKKRKPPEENTKDSSDESTQHKKSKSNSDTYSDEHFFKTNKNFKLNEPIEESNEKSTSIVSNITDKEFSFWEKFQKALNELKGRVISEIDALIDFEKFRQFFEYDLFPFVLLKYYRDKIYNFNEFNEDFTNYTFNNLKPLINDKKFIEVNKNIAYNKKNELFFKEFNKFSNFRWTIFIEALEKYNIKVLQEYKDSIKPEHKCKKHWNKIISQNDKENFDINEAVESYKNCPEENQIEPFVSALVDNSKKNFIEREINEQKNIFGKTPIIQDSLEIQNFNLGEMAMISILNGVKYNTNITEINLNGNPLSHKSCFWLGTCLKTLPYLNNMDISNCMLDNDKLYMFIEGMIFLLDEKLNKEQFNLSKLNLKDNQNITDNNLKNDNFEHPIALILKKCKLKNLNLTNAKIGNNGARKIFIKMNELLDNNKLILENLILISNNIHNEECLTELGNLLVKKNCPLKKLILSKNFISTFTGEGAQSTNYFEKLMKCIELSQLKELFLLNCNIGNDVNDLNIIYEMLRKNKSLTSIRLFGNKICDSNYFAKILGIFSDYNKPLENEVLTNLDLSKNNCHLIMDENFMKMIEKLNLKYLDINQNYMKDDEKEIFMKKTFELTNIRIIY